MFTLVTGRNKFFRIRRGQSPSDIEKTLGFPVTGEFFTGRIVEGRRPMRVYIVKPAETYRSVAAKLNVSVESLMEVNGARPLFPYCRLFVPGKDL